jgi:hypothetical protein
MHKPPFFIVDEFLNEEECLTVLDRLTLTMPSEENGKFIKTILGNKVISDSIIHMFSFYEEDVENYYKVELRNFSSVAVEWFPQNCRQDGVVCENSFLRNGEWKRRNANDFTAIIFLKNRNTTTEFDEETDVYGGTLQFPVQNVSIHPKMGTLVLFPSGPHFRNNTLSPQIGDMVQLRFQIVCEKPYNYSLKDFPGDYRTWWKGS